LGEISQISRPVAAHAAAMAAGDEVTRVAVGGKKPMKAKGMYGHAVPLCLSDRVINRLATTVISTKSASVSVA